MIDFRFYLITDRTLCAPRTLASVVHDACVSGVRAVQLREKDFPANDVVTSTTRLTGLLHVQGAKLFVNVATVEDDTLALIAVSPGIDGFHVPDDPDLLVHIRRTFPKHLIGASTHTIDGVRNATAAGADFLTFGPVYFTPGKKKNEIQGIEILRKACAATKLPVFAIGGVTAEHARECLDAGAHGVAVIRAVMEASSPRRAVREFAEVMGEL
ncbi:MAG TPA: thiamine phosphate synthase [Candidatus Krumholzibacteria bacterium]|nr:thiamine phosphate synthase [Candidatus Krumholzibacteria bacterium]